MVALRTVHKTTFCVLTFLSGVTETRRIRLAARHFQRIIDQVELATDYALMAEIAGNPEKIPPRV